MVVHFTSLANLFLEFMPSYQILSVLPVSMAPGFPLIGNAALIDLLAPNLRTRSDVLKNGFI
jgi:hypothetical protein